MATNPTVGFGDACRRAGAAEWQAATRHRFVVELAADRLADAAFARYLVLDYAFIEQLVGLVGHAVAVAPEMPAKLKLAGFLTALTGDENDYFLRSFRAMGLPPPSHGHRPAHPVLDAFDALMRRQMRRASYLDTMAVLLPVEWVYLTWAREARQAGATPARFYLKEWIDLHVDDGFTAFIDWMCGQFDAAAAAATPAARRRARQAFAEAVRLEIAFFDAAYEA